MGLAAFNYRRRIIARRQAQERNAETVDTKPTTDTLTEGDLIIVGGGVYELPNGERIRGKEAALEALAELSNGGDVT